MKNKINCSPKFIFITFFLIFVVSPSFAGEEEPRERSFGPGSEIGLSASLRSGYVHQFDADIDNGGSFSVNRLFIQGGPTHTRSGETAISLTIGYGLDNYDFSGDSGFGGLRPWEDIHTFRLSIPFRWRVSEKWSGFAAPTLRFTGESRADFSDSLTGGAFAGFAYKFSERLRIGPGIGVLTQIEDSTSVIPIIVINWKITNTLSLNTGRGIAASHGPGLTLDWQPSRNWAFSISGRYESLRFRLANDGPVPNGIGDDRSLPLFVGIAYSFTPMVRISAVGGIEVGGELRLEDESGNTITEQDHDPTGFLGITFSGRF